jgi:N-alpha-acetyltransferase 10/11
VEAKYYADGEDAYSMKLDLGFVREQVMDELEDGEVDEGEPVGELGKLEDGAADKKVVAKEGKKRKVRVGRGLGVGDLVEKNESQKA